MTGYTGSLGEKFSETVLDEQLEMDSGSRYLVPTGLRLEIPYGHCVKVYPRSGIAIKKGITLVNATGIIDSDYRDELFILMINLGCHNYISHGDRVAQMELSEIEDFVIKEVKELTEAKTERRGGMGSTGEQ